MDIADLITDRRLLGPFFAGSSWDRWRAVLKASYGLPLSDVELPLFKEVAGDRAPPLRPVREIIICAGRGAGKDAIASAIAAHAAISLDPSCLRPGEKGSVLVVANSKDQAAIARDYTASYFERIPMLSQMVAGPTADGGILLKNGAEIITVANSMRAPRGRRIICAIFDECATWRSDESATPDHEVDAAVAPNSRATLAR